MGRLLKVCDTFGHLSFFWRKPVNATEKWKSIENAYISEREMLPVPPSKSLPERL